MAIFKPADILIPQNVDFTKWSVVACDQYTSEREYWEDVKNIVGDSPSTLNIIFPEVYLEDGDGDERIKKINNTMEEYINQGIFRELKDTFIYVKRTQPNGKTRHGIVGMLDLEEYDFSKGSQSKVRATDGTIIERIPPRQRIRKNAPLEAPHILILIDDREKAVVEPLENQINDFEKIYDFDLMKNSGHIVGYNVNESAKKNILDAIEKLGDKADFEAKYGVKDKGVLMFAAGDGNHSLATAKTCWEEIKKELSEEEIKTHPAYYLKTHPIYYNGDACRYSESMKKECAEVIKSVAQKLINKIPDFAAEASKEANAAKKREIEEKKTEQKKEYNDYISCVSAKRAQLAQEAKDAGFESLLEYLMFLEIYETCGTNVSAGYSLANTFKRRETVIK